MRSVVVMLTAVVPVQQVERAQRATLRGRVLTSDGKPWSSAEVTLHSRSVPGLAWVGELDQVHVATDERGKFRARILKGRSYVVWAVSEANGRYRTTGAIARVGSGQTLTLRERKSVLACVTVRLASPRAPVDGPPFRCIVTSEPDATLTFEPAVRADPARPSMPIELFEVIADARGRVEIPRLPWLSCTLEGLHRPSPSTVANCGDR